MVEYTLNEMALQRAVFPQPKCHLLLADAAAIKVRSLYLETSQTPSTLPLRRSQTLVQNFQSRYFDTKY